MAGTVGWLPPVVWVHGNAITAEHMRLVLEDLADKFGKISGKDLHPEPSGYFALDSDLDLLGHELKGARNVLSGVVNVLSRGVVSSDTVDQSKAIQNALDGIANDGYYYAYFPGGTYISSASVIVPPGMSIMGTGSSTIFKVSSPTSLNAPFFTVNGNCSIRDISFIGDSSYGATRAGISVIGGEDISIQNIYAKNIYSAVSIASSIVRGIHLEDIVVNGCTYGVMAANTKNISIVSLFSTSTTVGLSMSGCSYFRATGISVEAGGAELLGESMSGVFLSSCNNGTVTGGVRSAQYRGFHLIGCSNVGVIGCHATDCNIGGSAGVPLFAGMELSGCISCAVIACHSYLTQATGTQTYGLVLNGGSKNVIACNDLTPNYGPTGTGTLSELPENCYLNNGSSDTMEFGNFPVVL